MSNHYSPIGLPCEVKAERALVAIAPIGEVSGVERTAVPTVCHHTLKEHRPLRHINHIEPLTIRGLGEVNKRE